MTQNTLDLSSIRTHAAIPRKAVEANHEAWMKNRYYRGGFDGYINGESRDASPYIEGYWTECWQRGWDYSERISVRTGLIPKDLGFVPGSKDEKVNAFLKQIAAANPEISPEGLLKAIFPDEPVPTKDQIAMEKADKPMTEMDLAFFWAVANERSLFDFRGVPYSVMEYAQDRLKTR